MNFKLNIVCGAGYTAYFCIDKKTMREFDLSCLTPIHQFLPEEIRALREREHVSQPIFATYFNVSKDLISQWERGIKKPAGTSLKLLSLVEST